MDVHIEDTLADMLTHLWQPTFDYKIKKSPRLNHNAILRVTSLMASVFWYPSTPIQLGISSFFWKFMYLTYGVKNNSYY